MRTMRRRGGGADTLGQYVITDKNLNHVTAIAPAQARRFFDGGLAGISSAP